MHADVVVDDELEAGKAHALVRNLAEVKGKLRVADVHHDLDGNVGQFAATLLLGRELEQPLVDVARVAFGAGHGDRLVFGEHFGCVAAAHHSRNAQLAGDDGRMAGASAAVGDDGARTLHHRLPVGVGHVGDQHVARLDALHLGSALDDAHGTGADLLADGAALGEHAALALEGVLDLDVGVLLAALHGLGTGLQDVDLAVNAVLAPLDVHRAAVVLLNDAGELGELDHVLVGEGEAVAVRFGHVHRAHGAAGSLVKVKLHLDELAAERLAHDRILALGKDGLVHVELVGVHGALHDGFAKAVAGRDEHNLVKAAFGVEREHHAGGALVGAAHALHARGQGHFHVGEALVDAVADGAVVVQRGEHLLHAGEHLIDADHVQVRLLLAGKGGVRQVLGGCRRANGHGDLLLAVLEPIIEFADFLLEFRGELGLLDPAADFSASLGELLHIVNVKGSQTLGDAILQAAFLDEQAETFSGCRKAVGNADPGAGELAEQFAKRGILAADAVDVSHAQLTKRKYITALNHLIL